MAKFSKIVSFIIIVLLLVTFSTLSCATRVRFTHSDHVSAVSKESQHQYIRLHRNLNRIEERLADFEDEDEPSPYTRKIRNVEFSALMRHS
ncbi:unnamed protein product [Brassica rapa]|uniref:Uncharacterized protein n=2 Tax=Brassica TaxID=3705 RepID=A0A3P6A8S8_BRACM|nr:unnamed protein product [Brassica napus]CAG7884812.1 unnamed protein product [Brassica rapa]CDY72023.1 BnaAnng39630D [Brassica napus]VDC83864.1 unnamed protein product [Brassica rapa]